ncbi:hypothetical protein ACP4OV_017132 [Aristida adscensionis]
MSRCSTDLFVCMLIAASNPCDAWGRSCVRTRWIGGWGKRGSGRCVGRGFTWREHFRNPWIWGRFGCGWAAVLRD